MSVSQTYAASETTLRAELGDLRRDGYLILPGLLGARERAELAGQLEPWLARTPRCQGDFHGWKTTRVNALLSKAPMVQGLALHPRILAMAEALLAASADCIQLNLTQAIRIHPGERAQIPHRDEEMWPADPKGQIWSLNVMWAVSDFTEANGATRLWRQSHRIRQGRTPDPAAATIAEMGAGSALLYLGGLTHGGGANCSKADRTGIVIGYCAGWLRTYENQYLAYPREVGARVPEALQRLIGYRVHRPNLGAWEGQDPIAYLKGGSACAAHKDALPPEIAQELKALLQSDGG